MLNIDYKSKWHYRLMQVIFVMGLIITIATLAYCSYTYGLQDSTDVWPVPPIYTGIILGIYRCFIYVKYGK